MATSVFNKIQESAAKAGIIPFTKKSKAWYYKNVRNLKGLTQGRLLRDPNVIPRQRLLTGRMYMFGYNPKHAETLPVYDRFPLIIHAGKAKGGFYGLNLHYLHPQYRAEFFDMLHRYSKPPGPPFTDLAFFFKLNYAKLMRDKKIRAFKLCYKHYLKSQLTTRVVQIPASQWELALFLPFDKFEKKDRFKVWRESRAEIPKLRSGR